MDAMDIEKTTQSQTEADPGSPSGTDAKTETEKAAGKHTRAGRTNAPRRGRWSAALVFIVLFGVVSLFSDMTHEGADSIRGAYLLALGASAGTIGFISGLGEMIGYSLRYVFGKLSDRTGKYWLMTIVGYVMDVVCVPALALVGEHGWVAACFLLVVQRMGKAVKKPSKDTIMSFAATQEGVGKSFGIQEVLDQIGAFLGPVFLYLILLFKSSGTTFERYRLCFAMLAIPGALTLLFLVFTRWKFPNPSEFEPEPEHEPPFVMKKSFRIYIIGISCFAFGFIDYSLIAMHVSRVYIAVGGSLMTQENLPLLYAFAMLVDAVAALIFGVWYDRKGVRVLIVSTLLSAPFSVLVFGMHTMPALFLGVALWGIGMGAQESIMKSVIAVIVPKSTRATGYGIFECAYGIFWFLGSWLMGVLYDISQPAMIGLSVIAQLAAIPFYLSVSKSKNQ